MQRVVSIIFAGEDRLSPAARAAQRTLSEFGTGLSGSVDALSPVSRPARRGWRRAFSPTVRCGGVRGQHRGKIRSSIPRSHDVDRRADIRAQRIPAVHPRLRAGQHAAARADHAGARRCDRLRRALAGLARALRVAEQGAVAGNAQLGESTRLLVGTLNAYGLGVDQVQRVSDVFFAPSATARSRSAIWQRLRPHRTVAAGRRAHRNARRRWPC